MLKLKTSLLLCALSTSVMATETLRVLNWSDYVDESLLEDFSQTHNVELDYVLYDTQDEFLEKLFNDPKGWDVVVPSDNLLPFLIGRNLLEPIAHSSINEFENLDPMVMSQLQMKDPGNQFAIPYFWGTTGIGINETVAPENAVDLVREQGWGVVFDDQYRAQFKDCGIAALYERNEIFGAALAYLGYSINSTSEKELAQASQLVAGLASDVKYLHSFRYIDDIANGNICLTIGYSGDIIGARFEDEATKVSYHIPKQGAVIWFDVFAIPKSSKQKSLALDFINYFNDAKHSALNSNYNAYPTPLLSSIEYVDEEILSDPGIYPPESTMKNLQAFQETTKKGRRLMKRYWVKATCAGSGLCEVPMSIGGY